METREASELQTEPGYTLIPSPEAAAEVALMMASGMPSLEAVAYFVSDPDPGLIKHVHDAWMSHQHIADAILKLQGKAWHRMSKDERLQWAKDKAYAEMGYFIYSHNYSDLTGADLIKYDSCRKAIETKLAGMEGKVEGLQVFWNDLLSGKKGVGPRGTAEAPHFVTGLSVRQ